MSKTPEEMAEKYARSIYRLKYYVDGRLKPSQGQEGFRWLAGKNGFLAGYKAAQQWISVEDRLPEYDQLALLWQSEMKAQFVGRRRDSGLAFPLYYWECTEDFFEAWKEIYFPKLMHQGVVTHWMPLPAPPKEEK